MAPRISLALFLSLNLLFSLTLLLKALVLKIPCRSVYALMFSM
uniref:Uncharacterized protein n=1 Tax=Brassica campestris TaxID=3711 RepID=A0A3P5YEQ3_BRACM|nr:unnamed protein product [Brassica rapa]